MSRQKIKPDPSIEWRTWSHDDIEIALAIVIHGLIDREVIAQTAINLMAYFDHQIENGYSYDVKQLERFAHHAFGKVARDGWSADQAFGLVGTKGRYVREHISPERDVELAAAMHLLNKHFKYPWDEARAKVAALFQIGEKTVETAYQGEVREEIELYGCEDLKEMLPEDVVSRLPAMSSRVGKTKRKPKF